MRVLVVGGSAGVRGALSRALARRGYDADVAEDRERGLAMVAAVGYDAVVLDAVRSGADGVETCRRLRAQGLAAPVLMLTAPGAVDDRVGGLDGGADDCLVPPISPEELAARIRALVRRGPLTAPPILEAGDLRLDVAGRVAWRGDVPIRLTGRELALLEMLMRHPGRALSRGQLVAGAWERGLEPCPSVIEAYVRALRGKIDRPFGRRALETVRGVGYRLRADGG
jgi:two-component system OmpR family response regulator